MKKHRQGTKPKEVLFPVYSNYILANHKELSRVRGLNIQTKQF